MEQKNQLGKKLKDRASGFEGIAVARVEHLDGSIEYCIQPPVGADGKLPDSFYFRAGCLVPVE
jgi:hypothetical protein